MNLIVTLLTLGLIGVVLTGFYLDRHPLPAERAQRLFTPTLTANVLVFISAQMVLPLVTVSGYVIMKVASVTARSSAAHSAAR